MIKHYMFIDYETGEEFLSRLKLVRNFLSRLKVKLRNFLSRQKKNSKIGLILTPVSIVANLPQKKVNFIPTTCIKKGR